MLLFLLSSLLLLTDVACLHQLKTAITTASNSTSAAGADGSRIVSCEPPTSVLLIRTADYLTSTASTGPFRASVVSQGGRMTSADVIKIYRHCHSRLGWCDVAGAGVAQEFEMTYYCLEGPFLDPCSNTTSEPLTNYTSLLFNYSSYSADCDVTCRCSVASMASEDRLYIRALNLVDEEEERHDGTGPRRSADVKGCNRTTEQPGPLVLMESPLRQWEVERRAVPVGWQLKRGETTSLSLTFQRMHGIGFGRLWMDFEGQEMQVSCGFTVQPRPSCPGIVCPDEPFDSGYSYASGHTLTYIYIGVAAFVVLMLLVTIVAVVKCRRRRTHQHARQKERARSPPDNQPAFNANHHVPVEGDYCTINDVPSAFPLHHLNTPCPSREEKQPISDETTFSESARSRDADTAVRAEARVNGNEYGCLNHGPSAPSSMLPRSDVVIYDHTGPCGVTGQDPEYHTLRHCVRNEPRVIDNVYDTMTTVAAP